MEKANSDRTASGIPESLRLPHWAWYKFGLFSENRLKRYFLTAPLTLCSISSMVIAMAQYVNVTKDVSDFVRNLEPIFAFTQVIGKILLVTHHVGDFLTLIETTKLFWNPNKCDQKTKTKLASIYRFIYRLQRAYQLSLMVGIVILITISLLGKEPPVGIWTLGNHNTLYYFWINQQIIAIPCIGIFFLGLELMYLGFCTEIVVQFKILCGCLENLTGEGNTLHEMEKSYFSKLKKCFQHHQLMLWFVKKFRQTFSLILLVQYFTICPLACAELFGVFESRDFQIKLRHFFLFVTLTLQLSFYCIPANYVADETLTVADAVCFSKWYIYPFPSLKKPLLIMMQNSQKEITINAGGLVPINTETFVTVLKVAWSACSLVRGLKQN